MRLTLAKLTKIQFKVLGLGINTRTKKAIKYLMASTCSNCEYVLVYIIVQERIVRTKLGFLLAIFIFFLT